MPPRRPACLRRLAATAFGLVLAASGGAALAQGPKGKTPDAPAEKVLTRVVGGRTAAADAWPTQVKIFAPDTAGRGRFRSHCGGTVVASTWVLTAAHCFVSATGPGARRQSIAAADVRIVAGRERVPTVIAGDDAFGRAALRVKSVVYHPDFDPRTFANDVALLELTGPSDTPASPIVGEADRDRDFAGLAGTVVGWGLTEEAQGSEAEKLPTDLQEVELPLVDLGTCRRGYEGGALKDNSIDARNLCAGFASGGRDACRGDSGGPLMMRVAGGGWVQAGIVSWGEGCGRAGIYGVYTRVAAFEAWIRQVTRGAIGQPSTPSADAKLSAFDAVAALPRQADTDGSAALAPFSLPTPADVARNAAVVERGDRALVIAIDGYPEPLSLKGSLNDAATITSLLTDSLGFRREQVMVLTNERATRGNILAALDTWLVQGSQPGARVFLYYSGQGFQTRMFPALRNARPGPTIVPVDLRLMRNDQGAVYDVENAILPSELTRYLERLQDRSTLAVFDATTLSARGIQKAPQARPEERGFVRSVEAVVDYAPELDGIRLSDLTAPAQPLPARLLFTGAGPDQWAVVDRSTGDPQGLFTRLFAAGLRARPLIARGGSGAGVDQVIGSIRSAADQYCAEVPESCRYGLRPQAFATGEAAQTGLDGWIKANPRAAARITQRIENPAGLKIDLVQTAGRSVGAPTGVRISARQAGHVILVGIDPRGQARQLFPDVEALMKDKKPNLELNAVAPGKPLTVTTASMAAGAEALLKPGNALVFAVLSDKPVQALDLPEQAGPSADAQTSFLQIYELVRTLKISDPNTGELSDVRWSFEVRSSKGR
ncbi:trypsin-like serine protease [Prosthecomicrobium sp. N25]|uniref:trypsin-like serine protease n=1 Tax=Prosthecomicrobium sp. N25 TaxID=3129254 RepID=UPI003077853B